MEGTYSGNFSNTFKKGTKLFSIKGVSTDEAIAIQNEDGIFTKAVREGEYAGKKHGLFSIIVGSLVLLASVAFIVVALENKINRRNRSD